jgi:DnaD/phage-associated family protein
MNYSWIKLYVEILDDPKVGMMPDWEFRRMIQMFLVAGEHNQAGLLGPVSELAWRLRSSEDDMLSALRTMSEIGIVAETPDGWRVVNFSKRQAALSSAERVSEYRKRERNDGVTKRYKKCNDGALHPSSSDSVSPSGSVTSGEGVQGEGAVYAAYEANIGVLTPMIADGLIEAINEYSSGWVMTAIEAAARHEKRSLAYVAGCLKGWRRDGLAKPPSANEGRPKQLKGDTSEFMAALKASAERE